MLFNFISMQSGLDPLFISDLVGLGLEVQQSPAHYYVGLYSSTRPLVELTICNTAGITLYRDCLYGNLYVIAIHDIWDCV